MRNYRIVIVSCIVIVCGLAWTYLIHRASAMPSSRPMPEMAMEMMSAPWRPMEFALVFLMWAVMMVGMMGPTVLPVLLLFAGSHARRAARGVPGVVLVFGLGYLTVWTGFSSGATILQWALSQAALLSPGTSAVSTRLGGVLLMMAGAYQLTPLKDRCLEHCRSPLNFLMSHWRDGAIGAYEMGLRHGVYCLGCCWALMAVLFVIGVMNLVWVAALTAFILLERIGRWGVHVSRIGGIALICLGATLFARPRSFTAGNAPWCSERLGCVIETARSRGVPFTELSLEIGSSDQTLGSTTDRGRAK